LLSCLYQLKSQLPFDFDLLAHGNERLCAMHHLELLKANDVVVYDRGYFCYPLLHRHCQTGIRAIFRRQESSATVIREFFASPQTDTEVLIDPAASTRADIHSQYPDLDIIRFGCGCSNTRSPAAPFAWAPPCSIASFCRDSHPRSPLCPGGAVSCWSDHPIPLGTPGGGLDEYQAAAADAGHGADRGAGALAFRPARLSGNALACPRVS
jgi:hypothetical protein